MTWSNSNYEGVEEKADEQTSDTYSLALETTSPHNDQRDGVSSLRNFNSECWIATIDTVRGTLDRIASDAGQEVSDDE